MYDAADVRPRRRAGCWPAWHLPFQCCGSGPPLPSVKYLRLMCGVRVGLKHKTCVNKLVCM